MAHHRRESHQPRAGSGAVRPCRPRAHRASQSGVAAILAGLVGEATSDEATRDAIEMTLYLGRADLVTNLVAGEAAHPDRVNEVIVAMVWRRLATRPQTLDDAFAAELAALALAAGSRP